MTNYDFLIFEELIAFGIFDRDWPKETNVKYSDYDTYRLVNTEYMYLPCSSCWWIYGEFGTTEIKDILDLIPAEIKNILQHSNYYGLFDGV